ncbi:PXA domain-domain-containing protein [Kockovaella imperatae]|uniref:PXA domain-domain-containing protein n=1 Tax=Kockovaella imperatae TaxID=4999 RepID=A0A1Y1UHU2_9TREE|nr:PXA domain-domain-containing protein [Kockovaella imperatae]ORX37630.1 PXA domain-domain-containing protein [Kockovaella imperatae]
MVAIAPVRVSHNPTSTSLHRKLLFPNLPATQPVPVLVPGEGKDIEILNDRIYNLVALAFRAYILSWLPRITKDQSVLPQINETILFPLLRPICFRLSEDPSSIIELLLIDLPSLLDLHITTLHGAKEALALGGGVNWDQSTLGDAYHARLPLMSVIKSETSEDRYETSPLWLTAFVEALLKLNVEGEEYDCLPERIMIRELIGRLVLGGIARRISQPWFWWGLGLKLIGPSPDPSIALSTQKSASILKQGSKWICRIWKYLLLSWGFVTWVFVLLAESPRRQTRYRYCALPTVRMVRSIIVNPFWIFRSILATLELFVSFASPVIDRVIPHLIESRLMTVKSAIRLVDLLERILFPLNGYPAPTPEDPTPEEAASMRRYLEQRISEIVPSFAIKVLPPPGTFLEPLSDADCNVHLIAMVYSAAIGALVPELVVGSNVKVRPKNSA